ncbi:MULTISPECIES: Nramp family divalent metal transporter [unclassified Janthinobacterium]|uniref:Nramp family divalent metal transporter n=1 Tax=unclassified Janthinobacterium TaxID=2610881 RepID=UPI0016113B39|nr:MULTISPECIES: Nramp family divalent metal transporter [unclassified Janthinobacterium]MBB5370644.1 manganese transport protein [Janthinobacterium sp. K2C7]MBB5383450.1 manganese transport protein [Janthinobacterium sp. K2Li3]MBB5388904.1 manganese transport protein [Janthinobacterium sp. K2E3]
MFAAIKRGASYALSEDATTDTVAAMRDVLDNQRGSLRSLLSFAGPAVVASVAYVDPGNFATNIQAGSTYGYELLWVVLLSSLVAMLFQAMSAKLGIVTGRNLAEICRDEFPRPLVIFMWIGSEIAAIATDLAEFMGGAIGISLLFGLAIGWGLLITGIITFAILSLDKQGFRPLEIVIAALVAVIGLSYLAELLIAPPDWQAAIFHTFVPQLHGNDALMLAVGIVGATIMPHSIYLHSGLTQHRAMARNDQQRRKLVQFSNREVVVALGLAGLVNMAMVAMSASVLSKTAPGIADIATAYHTLAPVLGASAATVFLISLLASGISSSVVGTMAGQNIMQGFVGFKIPVLVRRLITMVPAVLVCMVSNPMKAMVDSQIILSIILPMPLIALVVLSSRRSVMGRFTACRKLTVAAVIATTAIVALNLALIWQALAA